MICTTGLIVITISFLQKKKWLKSYYIPKQIPIFRLSRIKILRNRFVPTLLMAKPKYIIVSIFFFIHLVRLIGSWWFVCKFTHSFISCDWSLNDYEIMHLSAVFIHICVHAVAIIKQNSSLPFSLPMTVMCMHVYLLSTLFSYVHLTRYQVMINNLQILFSFGGPRNFDAFMKATF